MKKRAGKRKTRKRTARRGGKRSSRGLLFAFLAAFTVLSIFFVTMVDRRLLPAALVIEEYRINARMNEAINLSLAHIMNTGDRYLVSEDFYTASRTACGRITSLHANTVLINEITMSLSQSLLEILSVPAAERVMVPIGGLLGVQWLANVGPSYNVRIMSVGAADVEYHTSFTAAGINQINFQVWLTVSATMQVVNPLQDSREVDVSRRIPLVNTVFAGEIPEVMLWPMGQ